MRLPLVHFFETSFGRVHDKHFILVRLDGGGASGFGECVADQDPYYSSETNDTAWHIIESFVAPRVLDVEFAHPRDVFPALKAIRGHNMAKAAVEMAAWDLYARQAGVPLHRVLGGTRDRIASGVSIGIQDSLADLAAQVEREIAAGYRRIKIKIKPGWDIDAVETVRARCGAVPLMVDANAAYTRGDADHLAKLDRYDLMMIEQPLDYDDIADHAVLQRRLKTPVCLDESIKTVGLAREAIAAGSSTSSPDGSAGLPNRFASTTSAPLRAFPYGMAACSSRASAARPTSICQRCRIFRCPATWRRASGTSIPI